MGVIDWFRGKSNVVAEKIGGSFFYFNDSNVFSNNITKYSNSSAYLLAKNIAEIYNPIDIISDRVASVDYVIRKRSDDSIVDKLPKNIERLLKSPNPLYTFQQLIYNIQFIELAQGGINSYVNISAGNAKKTENINSIWFLEPNLTNVKLKKLVPINPFSITSVNDLIDSYDTFFLNRTNINKDDVISNTFSSIDMNDLRYISELKGAERNINNLIAVYEARYNAYKNNGAAGILTRKQAVNGDMAQFEGNVRQDMVDQLNESDGVMKGKNFIGISAVPMEFIKTLGTIQELQPFEETADDQLKIAGIYNVPKFLLPTASGTTFTNQAQAEISIWQNTIKPFCVDMAAYLDKLFYLTDDLYFAPDFDGVEILQTDRKLKLEGDLLELDLLAKLRELQINNDELEKKWKV
jgi:hypothetical protein